MKMSIDCSKDGFLYLEFELKLPNIWNLSKIIGETDREYLNMTWDKRNRNETFKAIEKLSPPIQKLGYLTGVLLICINYKGSRKRRLGLKAVLNGIYFCRLDFGRKLGEKYKYDTKYGTPKDQDIFLEKIKKYIVSNKLGDIITVLALYLDQKNKKRR